MDKDFNHDVAEIPIIFSIWVIHGTSEIIV